MIVAVAVIFLPELLRPSAERGREVVEMEIPAPPVHTFKAQQPVPATEILALPTTLSQPLSPVAPADTGATDDSTGADPGIDPDANPPLSPPLRAEIAAPAPVTVPSELRSWVVQVGSFSDQNNALALRDRLREEGFVTFVEPADINGRKLYRVRVGPELQRSTAERLKDQLSEKTKLEGQLRQYP